MSVILRYSEILIKLDKFYQEYRMVIKYKEKLGAL